MESPLRLTDVNSLTNSINERDDGYMNQTSKYQLRQAKSLFCEPAKMRQHQLSNLQSFFINSQQKQTQNSLKELDQCIFQINNSKPSQSTQFIIKEQHFQQSPSKTYQSIFLDKIIKNTIIRESDKNQKEKITKICLSSLNFIQANSSPLIKRNLKIKFPKNKVPQTNDVFQFRKKDILKSSKNSINIQEATPKQSQCELKKQQDTQGSFPFLNKQRSHGQLTLDSLTRLKSNSDLKERKLEQTKEICKLSLFRKLTLTKKENNSKSSIYPWDTKNEEIDCFEL